MACTKFECREIGLPRYSEMHEDQYDGKGFVNRYIVVMN